MGNNFVIIFLLREEARTSCGRPCIAQNCQQYSTLGGHKVEQVDIGEGLRSGRNQLRLIQRDTLHDWE